MSVFQTKRKHRRSGVLAAVLVFLLVLCLFWFGFGGVGEKNHREQLAVTQNALQRAVVNCYAIEGVYPPDVEYLEDHYGVLIDHSRFLVHYERIGPNVMPSVEVLEQGG